MELNTDRMWWTIGVIIVGALLIAAIKVAFPQVLNSVIEFFRGSIQQSIEQFRG